MTITNKKSVTAGLLLLVFGHFYILSLSYSHEDAEYCDDSPAPDVRCDSATPSIENPQIEDIINYDQTFLRNVVIKDVFLLMGKGRAPPPLHEER